MRPTGRCVASTVLVVLAALVVGCGGPTTGGSGQAHVGKARAATNLRSGHAVPGGVVDGTPPLGGLNSVPPPAGLSNRRGGCTGIDMEPAAANTAQVAGATLCLLNAERRARGLRALHANPLLARAALGHSRDMVAAAYFSHDSRSGASFIDRIRRAGYIGRGVSWTAGENLAWGTGERATPEAIVAAWMDSPGHRANILRPAFREVGLGIALGTPVDGHRDGATYGSDFGARSRA